MTAKEYLRQAYRLDQRINSDIEEVARLRQMAGSISSPVLGDRVQTSQSPDAAFTRTMNRVFDMERTINSEIDRFVDIKDEIRKAIDLLDNTDEKMVLRYRYIQNWAWEKIAVEMGWSIRWTQIVHGRALQNIDGILREMDVIK